MEAHAEHHHSTKPYFVVYTILMVLLVVTVAMAYVHFGVFNLALAMVVATIKAALVVMYFMHAKDSSPLILTSLLSGLVMLLIGFLLLFSDYLTR